MRPYQEEYLANLRQFAALTQRVQPGDLSLEDYAARLEADRERLARLGRRNMELLRTGLFPVLDDLFDAGEEELACLEEFSFHLFNGQIELDVGLFCQIHQALLTAARQRRDQAAMIRELYWLGMGRNSMCGKLVGFELPDVQKYMHRMRLCFTEAAAYLKYYDELQDNETRSYVLRSRANMSLGQFASPSEKVHLVKQTLQILQDEHYQELAPELPWERFIYLTHQNMTSSITHSREKVMTPEDMADIMESSYIVYQRRFEEAEKLSKQPPAKSAFAYYAIEYYCGLYGVDRLFQKLEELLDGADPTDYSLDGMYAMASLPAFYSQYLGQYPEFIPPRREYIQHLYQRTMDYMDAFPKGQEDGRLFLYLRQLSFTYLETEGGVPYGEFLQKLLLRFATEVFLHSWVVGEAARALCAVLLEDDPCFFDDIEQIRAAGDRAQKRQAVLELAMGCGLFHDVGKISVLELYSRTPRQWFEIEYDMARLHTIAGAAFLSSCPSTRRYADAALGHHAWYDGSRGYPDAYQRLDHPARQMVDVIALADWLEAVTNPTQFHSGGDKTFEEAVQSAIELEGKRFSPLLTALLRDDAVVARLRQALSQGRQDAYRQMYDDARRSCAPQT